MTASSRKSLGLIISENVECLAIAIAMALVLKFFIIEAYKIPSGSMQPTIIGNPETEIYDRVLVNKFLYLFEDPKRWDVIVFKYPLNQSENYIKRLIGLPGETIEIKNGDIYADGAIARKPWSVVRSVMKQVYPSGKPGERFEDVFAVQAPGLAAGGGEIRFPEAGRATIANIRARYLDGYDPDYGIPFPRRINPDESQFVGDLMASFEVELTDASGGVLCEIAENGRVHSLFLRGAERDGPSYLESYGTKVNAPGRTSRVWSSRETALPAGRAAEVVFLNVDDRLAVRIDGREVASFEYETEELEHGEAPCRVTFGPVDSGALFRDLSVSRDIYYLADTPGDRAVFHVPRDHYFAMGDNTQNSSDGRKWQMVTLKLRDGRVLRGEYQRGRFPLQLRSPTGTRWADFVDIYGDHYRLRGIDLAGYPEIAPQSFVDRKFMLGRAMAVFWPIYPHFRWKLIR